MCLVSFKSQHNDKTRWNSAGFVFSVRLIGTLIFLPQFFLFVLVTHKTLLYR